MNNLNRQKGFATLEIIFVLAIISTLMFAAVPKIEQVIDKITLDYEMKKFLNEVELAYSLNRSINYNAEIFQERISKNIPFIELEILKDVNRYQLRRNSEYLLETNFLPTGFSIDYNPDTLKDIEFDFDGIYDGKSGTVTLTSRFRNSAEIIFDSVGRWRGNLSDK